MATVDRSVVLGGVAGAASGLPLAFPLQWFVKVRYGVEMPFEVAASAAVFITGVVGVLQGVITQLIPSSPRVALTNLERRERGLYPDLNQPLTAADVRVIQRLLAEVPVSGDEPISNKEG